jgi:hypothetical protein
MTRKYNPIAPNPRLGIRALIETLHMSGTGCIGLHELRALRKLLPYPEICPRIEANNAVLCDCSVPRKRKLEWPHCARFPWIGIFVMHLKQFPESHSWTF